MFALYIVLLLAAALFIRLEAFQVFRSNIPLLQRQRVSSSISAAKVNLVDNAHLYKVMRNVELKAGEKFNAFNKESCQKFVDSLTEVANKDSAAQRTVLSYALKQYYTPVPWISQPAKTAVLITLATFTLSIVLSLLQIIVESTEENTAATSDDDRLLVAPAYPLPSNEVLTLSENLDNPERTMKEVLLDCYGYYLNADRAVRRGVMNVVEWLKGI